MNRLHKILLISLVFISGCTYMGMTEYDKQSQDAGLILHCTEYGNDCITHQWVNPGEETTFRRYTKPEGETDD